jgi:hypothetical protein
VIHFAQQGPHTPPSCPTPSRPISLTQLTCVRARITHMPTARVTCYSQDCISVYLIARHFDPRFLCWLGTRPTRAHVTCAHSGPESTGCAPVAHAPHAHAHTPTPPRPRNYADTHAPVHCSHHTRTTTSFTTSSRAPRCVQRGLCSLQCDFIPSCRTLDTDLAFASPPTRAHTHASPRAHTHPPTFRRCSRPEWSATPSH